MTHSDVQLRTTIDEALPRLMAMSDAQAGIEPAPGKWCPKEVIGHLLDSANNNLARFVRLQHTDDLLFEGYEQETWVKAQGYATAGWAELVELWARYNRHIARVMELVPHTTALAPRRVHRALVSTYAPLPADGVPTLHWLMCDYVGHLQHHVQQIG